MLLVYLEFCRLPDAFPPMNSFSKSQKGSSVTCDDDTRPVRINCYDSDCHYNIARVHRSVSVMHGTKVFAAEFNPLCLHDMTQEQVYPFHILSCI